MQISEAILEQITKLSKKSTTSLSFVFHKIVEEVGELSKAINQPQRCKESDVAEAVDVLLATADYLNKSTTPEELDRIMKMKLAKWKKQVKAGRG